MKTAVNPKKFMLFVFLPLADDAHMCAHVCGLGRVSHRAEERPPVFTGLPIDIGQFSLTLKKTQRQAQLDH